MTSLELKQTREGLIVKAKQIVEKADLEKREMTPEENTQFDELMGQATSALDSINTLVRKEAVAQAETESRELAPRKVKLPATIATRPEERERKQALRNFFLRGTEHYDGSMEAYHRGLHCGINGSGNVLNIRGTSTQVKGTDALGGYLTNSSMFDGIWESAIHESGLLSAVFRDVTSDGNTRLYPTGDDTFEGVIVGENSEVIVADTPFSQVSIPTFKMTSRIIKASLEFIQDSIVDVEGYIAKTIGARIARGLENQVVKGAGTTELYGIEVGATEGVADVSYLNGPTYANMVDLKMSMPTAYIDRGTFVMSKSFLAKCMKIVDENSRPIWQESMTANNPSTILGRPFIVSDYVDDFATSAKPCFYVDLQQYVLRQALDVQVKVLNDRFAEYGVVAWLGFARFGGRWVGPAAANRYLSITSSASSMALHG